MRDNNSDKNKIWFWANEISIYLIKFDLRKLFSTGLYDHGMIKDDQTST